MSMPFVLRRLSIFLTIAAGMALLGSPHVHAQDDDLEGRVAELEERVASLEATVAALVAPSGEAAVTPAAGMTTRAAPGGASGDGSTLTGPLAKGESGVVGDYLISVVSVDFDAEAAVLAENQFNDPAAPGNTMVMASLEFTYQGIETGNIFWDLSYKVVGARGLAYADTDQTVSCGSLPNSIMNAPELYPGGTVVANVCWQIPEDEAATIVMVLEPLFSFDDNERMFFALQ
ncbi:MAG: hypothetical protein KF883_05450 [Thermomicrobiales bacterium]|nr:hypothetical protein [Thermomicrobiales bacterium]